MCVRVQTAIIIEEVNLFTFLTVDEFKYINIYVHIVCQYVCVYVHLKIKYDGLKYVWGHWYRDGCTVQGKKCAIHANRRTKERKVPRAKLYK